MVPGGLPLRSCHEKTLETEEDPREMKEEDPREMKEKDPREMKEEDPREVKVENPRETEEDARETKVEDPWEMKGKEPCQENPTVTEAPVVKLEHALFLRIPGYMEQTLVYCLHY